VNKHEALILNLSSNLGPVTRPPNINRLAIAWCGLSAVYVIAVTQLFGPIRPGAIEQLGAEPRYLLETMFGVVSILWFGLLAFRSAIPAALSKRFAVAGLVLMALWLGQYAIGFLSPALEPSGLGKRSFCYLETMVYSLPVIFSGLFLVRRLFPLSFVRTGMSVGLVAGMMPALYMQLACMYEPAHILAFHIAPGLLMVGVGAGAAAWWRLRSPDFGK
jgi:hypothetical protein